MMLLCGAAAFALFGAGTFVWIVLLEHVWDRYLSRPDPPEVRR